MKKVFVQYFFQSSGDIETIELMDRLAEMEDKMTNYYYVTSDQKMGLGNASIDFVETESYMISGFDYPIQIEVFNGIEKEWELRELLQYIRNHTAPYKVCTVQVANLLNSNQVELKAQKKYNILLHEIVDPKQLLLQDGHLLTIKKVPVFQ